jgi:hypothetical protein
MIIFIKHGCIQVHVEIRLDLHTFEGMPVCKDVLRYPIYTGPRYRLALL